MSGLVKGVKKVFKAVGKVMKSPIFKAIVIAAAVYFTGGLALGAMGSTFAASLPGITGLAEGLGITAGAFGAAAEATGAALAAGAAGAVDVGMEAATVGATAGDAAGAAEAAGAVQAGTEAATVGAAASDAAVTGATGTALDAGMNGAVQVGEEAATAGGDVASAASGAPAPPTPSGIANSGFSTASDLEAGSGAQPMTAAQQAAAAAKPDLTPGLNPSGLSDGAKKMLFDGLKEGGLAVFKGLSQKQALDQQAAEYQQNRQDVIRRGQVPDISGIYKGYKTPGVVNSFVNQAKAG
jgi:hypothetical protein